MHAGRWDDALAHYRAAGAAAAQAGDVATVAGVEVNQGFLLLRRGELAEADRLGVRSQRAFDALGMDDHAAYGRYLRSRVATADGAFEDGTALMAEARAAFVRSGSGGMVVDCDVATVDTLTRSGRPAEAVAFATAIESAVARHGDPIVAVTYDLHRALAEIGAGDTDAGRDRLLATLAEARQHRLPYDVHRCLAALVELENAGGPPAPDGARVENGQLATQLGLTPGNPRVS
jgi:cytochrome c1